MKRHLALALIAAALLAAAPFAQTPARDSRAPTVAPSGTAALAGVVAEPDGTPVRRASVSITGDMKLTRTQLTDDAGKFTFAKLPAGRFTLTADKGGYPEFSYGASRPFRTGSSVILAEGQQVLDLKLKLAPGAVMTGTVFDERGQPLPDVPVMAWEVRTTLSGERTLASPASGGEWVTSDDRGQYRVFGLPPGEYTVGTAWFYSSSRTDARVLSDTEIRAAFAAVTQPPVVATGAPAPAPPSSAVYNYTPVFFPGATDPLAATTMTLGPGDVREGVDIRMQFRPTSKIEGVVVDPNGPLKSRVEFQLLRRSTVSALNSTTVSVTSPDGRFSTGSLAPGLFTVLAETMPSPTAPPMWARQDVTLGVEPMNITLALQPALSLAGRVIFDGTTLKPPSDFKQVIVFLLPMSTAASSGRNSPAPTIDATGAFTINTMTPGTFRVRATIPAAAAGPGATTTWVLAKVTQNDQDVTDLPFEIAGGVNPAPLVITFTDRPSELSGQITTPAGVAAADFFVVAFPGDKRYWMAQSRRIVSARPDMSGRYTFRNLPPGDYRVAATTDLVTSDLSDASALEKLSQMSASVTVRAGEKAVFDFKIGG